MKVSFSHVSHAVSISAKLTVRLTLQFVSVSPFNVRLGQTRRLGLKVWVRTKHFSGVSTSVFIIVFNNFLGKTKFGEAQKI